MNKREKEFSNQFIEISEEERERRKQKKLEGESKLINDIMRAHGDLKDINIADYYDIDEDFDNQDNKQINNTSIDTNLYQKNTFHHQEIKK